MIEVDIRLLTLCLILLACTCGLVGGLVGGVIGRGLRGLAREVGLCRYDQDGPDCDGDR